MQKMILIDIHNTLLNKDGSIDDYMLMLCRVLHKHYTVGLITASYYADDEMMRTELANVIDFYGTAYDKIYYNNVDKKYDDAEIKRIIYTRNIESVVAVEFVIDNNKDVCKMFRSMGIRTLRYKQ